MKKFLIIVSIIIFLGLFSIRFYRDYFQYRILKQEVNRLILEQKNLQQERERLEKLQEAGSKTEILEKWARTIMGMKKEKEEVVLVTPINNINEVATTTKIISVSSTPSFIEKTKKIWYDFLRYFKEINIINKRQ